MAFYSSFALLLSVFLINAANAAHQPSVREIVKTRLIAGFKEGCNPEETSLRSLRQAVKTAYVAYQRREGKTIESAASLVLNVKETASEDYTTYSRSQALFQLQLPSDSGGYRLTGLSAPSNACIINNQHLKRVGVSVVSVADCPLVSADIDSAISAFRDDSCVSFVERDSIQRLYPIFEGPPIDETAVRPSAPPPHPSQPSPLAYWLEVASIDRAWKLNKCDREVVVGVIDTGVEVDHPDLRNNIWRNEYEIPANGIDDDRNGYTDDINGFDFFLKRAQVVDPHGHGTHCAGIIGATPITTVAQGVCKNISIAGLRFLDDQGSGATSDSIEAVNYAIEMDFHLTSNSWGGPDVSSGLLQAIKRASDVEQLFVAAAGNSGNNADVRPEYPGAYKVDNVISVAATDENDRLANFSNYGKNAVHLAAPGVFILSTFPPHTVKSLSGTSMATPVVSGVAAMLLSHRPMRVAELKEILFTTADKPRSLKDKLRTGGRVSAAYAICVARAEDPESRSILTRSSSSSSSSNSSNSNNYSSAKPNRLLRKFREFPPTPTRGC